MSTVVDSEATLSLRGSPSSDASERSTWRAADPLGLLSAYLQRVWGVSEGVDCLHGPTSVSSSPRPSCQTALRRLSLHLGGRPDTMRAPVLPGRDRMFPLLSCLRFCL